MRKRHRNKPKRSRHVPGQKPRGCFQERVQKVGPEHFGIIPIDCGKPKGCTRLADFYGNVLLEPFSFEVSRPGLDTACAQIEEACERHDIRDCVCVIETTGRYHLPIRKVFEERFGESRNVHPYTSSQVRKSADLGNKTDPVDVAAIHRAAVNGLAMENEVLSAHDQAWRLLTRHRRDLVEKGAKLKIQLKELLHAYLPGYTSLWKSDFWESSIGATMATTFASAEAMRQASDEEFIQAARNAGGIIQKRTIHRIRAWTCQAAAADDPGGMYYQRACSLWRDLCEKNSEIADCELDLAVFLCQSPCVRLLVFPGINVVSASDYGAELGPITNYATSKSIAGRAGLYPSRYQSSNTDHCDGPLIARRNRQLRAALMRIARNLKRSNDYFMAKSLAAKQEDKPGHTHVIVARMFSRLSFYVIAGPTLPQHPAMQPKSTILQKVLTFLYQHNAPTEVVVQALDYAAAQLPNSSLTSERSALHAQHEEIHQKGSSKKSVRRLDEILSEVLLRLAAQYPEDANVCELTTGDQSSQELIEDATHGT